MYLKRLTIIDAQPYAMSIDVSWVKRLILFNKYRYFSIL